jgi:homoserine O-acetyltransferase/O-succinyltransferase
MRTIRLLLLLLVTTPLAFAIQVAPDGSLQYANLGTCKLASDSQIEHCRLGYRTWGTLNADKSNAILFPTWFSGNSGDLAQYIGADKMIDPARYFFIGVDALGNGVSSSPSNSATQHGPAFPAFTTRDMVNAEYRLVTETLGLKHLRAVMGSSMGGMQTFEWIVNYPGMMDIAIPIVGSTKLTGYDLLLWNAEANSIRQDPAWKGGNYTQKPPAGEAMTIHNLALTTPAHYARETTPEKFQAIDSGYVSKGIPPFDANDWLAQLDAMIHHDVAHGGSLDDAAKKVKAKVLVISSAQDHMVNPQPALDFAKRINAQTLILESDCGHLAPGCESGRVSAAVRSFLAGN